MPYYNRANQLYNTLGSFNYHYRDRHDYEVIIAEDVKTRDDESEHNSLRTVVACFNLNMNIKHIETEYENCWNPAPLICDAVDRSEGKFLVLTNPEVFHKSNILGALDMEFRLNNHIYVVAACENAKFDKYYEHIDDIKTFQYEHLSWYQHSEHRNRMLHFCTAISRKNYDEVGGFDKRYMYGAGVEDVDFLEKVKKNNIRIEVRDTMETIHQDHGYAQDIIPDFERLWQINKNLYSAIHG
jgi:hypothetical protein